MSLVRGFEVSGNILQFAMPAATWISDILPDIYVGRYKEALRKTAIIALLVIVQNRGCYVLKQCFPKERPNKRDYESFPSGHMMIATQVLVRLVYKYELFSKETALGIASSASIALGCYLPGWHDVIDLTAGALLGIPLGIIWNKKTVNKL